MSAFRALRQLSVSSSRALATRSAVSSVSVARFAPAPAVRSFSVSARALGQGSTDGALSAKLHEELTYEIDAVNPKEVPPFITEFKAQGIWKIEDTEGSDEVIFSRTFGNENIRLTLSVVDLRNEPEEDQEYENEENENEEEPQEEDETITTYPLNIAMTISKGDKGALGLDLLCSEGQFVVENVAFYPDAKMGTALTAEANWQRNGVYSGPQFDVLDIGLQEEFERFLQERGVNEALANFIPDFAEHKEQEEYTRWLKNVKSFIDA